MGGLGWGCGLTVGGLGGFIAGGLGGTTECFGGLWGLGDGLGGLHSRAYEAARKPRRRRMRKERSRVRNPIIEKLEFSELVNNTNK